MRKILIVTASALLFGTTAWADKASEVEIAQDHAGLAIKASNIAGVQMHLHHTINCLVGPAGDGFDTKSANPCAKAGNGAIPDSSNAKQKAALQNAVMSAKQGLMTTDFAAAQKSAKETADAISTVN
jgi:hypothetical protein